MNEHLFQVMFGGLQVGLQALCFLLGVDLLRRIYTLSDRVRVTNIILATEELVNRGKVAITLFIISTVFTAIRRFTTLALVLRFIEDTNVLVSLDSTYIPLAITVLQFVGILLIRESVVDAEIINGGRDGNYQY